MSLLRRSIAAAAISAAILLSGGACTSDHPTAGPSATASASSVSVAALSAVDTAICATVKDASRDLLAFMLANPRQDHEAAIVDALTKFALLVQAKKADAAAPRLRDALQYLGASAEWQAISLGDRASAAIGDASEQVNRACGEPANDQLVAGDWIGTAKSPCEFPVSFQTGKGWLAVAVGAPWGDRARKESLAMVCEIAAKPAGHIAFIRVWTDPRASGGPRRALDAYLRGEDVRNPVWSDLTLGGAPGTEVVYGAYSESLKETRTERAFAVQTPKGVVVVMVGGMDVDDKAVVAAYELAKKTLAVNA